MDVRDIFRRHGPGDVQDLGGVLQRRRATSSTAPSAGRKDHVARTMLGRDVVFGNDIVEQRLALNVVRPFEKGVLKYNNADTAGCPRARSISTRRPPACSSSTPSPAPARRRGRAVYGIIGAPARANVLARRIILEAAQDAFDAAMIVSEPFLIAYGMNRLNDTLVIDIGAGTIDLCPVYGTFPKEEDQVTLPIGGDFIDEHFYNAMRKNHPEAQLSLNMAREIKEKYGFVHDVNEQAVVTLPVNGKPTQIDVTDVLKDACQVLVPPIIDGLRELIGRFDPEFQQRMLHNIVLGGGGSQLKGLDRVIEEGLKELRRRQGAARPTTPCSPVPSAPSSWRWACRRTPGSSSSSAPPGRPPRPPETLKAPA